MKNANEKTNYKSRINKGRFKTKFLSLVFLLFSVTLCLIMFSGCASESEPQCNHEWGEWEETSVATCTKSGMQQRICSICGQTESKGIARLSSTGQHTPTEWTVTKTATCTEPGEQENTCSVCGETITEEIEPLGHQLGEWEIGTEATAQSSGEKIQKCTVCGEIINRDTYYLTTEEIAAAEQAAEQAIEQAAAEQASNSVSISITKVDQRDGSPYVYIYYQCKNTTNSDISKLRIRATLYDSSGNALTSQTDSVSNILAQQFRETFILMTCSTPFASYSIEPIEVEFDN